GCWCSHAPWDSGSTSRSDFERRPTRGNMKTTIDLADRPAWQSSRRIIQRFWAIAGPYWKGEDRWIGAALLTLALGGVLGRVITVVALNSTNGAFFNSLQNKDSSAF